VNLIEIKRVNGRGRVRAVLDNIFEVEELGLLEQLG